MQYRREIDGLRAIAVLPVILFHAGFSWFSGGYVGVDVFFVISGYLITSILLHDLETGSFSITKFYERRARRILPALFFVMLCSIPFAWAWMTTTQFKDFSQGLVAISLFASNILFWKKEDYFAQPAEENPLLHTWSLAVEEQFYIFFPILLLFLWRFGKRPIFWTVIFLSLCSLMLSEWGWRNAPTANFYFLPTRARELGAGATCAFLLHGQVQKSNSLLSAVGLLLILYSIFTYNEETPFPSIFTLVPVIGTALIILYGSKETFVAKILHAKIFVGIGLISFSAYLWHQPLLAFARIYSFSSPSILIMGALSLLSLVLAYISWRYVETPFREKSKIGLTRNQIFTVSGMASGFFIIAGMIGHVTDGLEQRLSPEQITWTAEVNELKKNRQASIKVGVCQFNRSVGIRRDIDVFLEQWNCQGNSIPNQKRLAIYGDSHSADKAVVLRSIGIEPLQMGGDGCPLIPKSNGKPYCDRLINKLIKESGELSIRTIILANRFGESEINIKHMQEIIRFWTTHFDKVILFTPMPEFPRFDSIYSFWGPRAQEINPDFSRHEEFYAVLSEIEKPENVKIINTSNYFCGGSISEACKPIQDRVVMLTDYGHLSPKGATIFGQRLTQDMDSTSQLFLSTKTSSVNLK
jgi:peptidoglycan/LPS O-acetylase OafA/YrhL